MARPPGVLFPNTPSTLSTTSKRDVDFGFISISIKQIHMNTLPIFTVPFGPHYGFLFSFNARPRATKGLVQCIPKPLPMNQFVSVWQEASTADKSIIIDQAKCIANDMLSVQKATTGVAMLGSPSPSLKDDPKFQGELLQAQLVSGEQLAFAALCSELVVLLTVDVPSKLRYK